MIPVVLICVPFYCLSYIVGAIKQACIGGYEEGNEDFE